MQGAFASGFVSRRLAAQKKESTLQVLFVCTGNICRSPTAERLALAMAEELRIPDFTAFSAGTRAVVGHPMHRYALTVLEGLGGSGVDFAARQLTPHIVAKADLVLAMTREHRNVVLERAPQTLHRAFTLVEAASLVSQFGARSVADLARLRSRLRATDEFDMADPIGQSPEVFATVGQRIAQQLPPILGLCHRSASSTE